MNRSKKSFKNVFSGLVSKFFLMLFAFVVRTIFIKKLGATYTGLNGLYTNILSVLSLAELGLGNVMMYHLYTPLKNNNKEKIRELVTTFKKLYNKIIILIVILGILLIPFLPIIVNNDMNTFQIISYYLLYLLNSAVSYLFIYRILVINADQNNYIINIVTTISTILMYITQIIFLYYNSFYVYLLTQVLFTIINNYVLNVIAIKKYPYIKNIDKSNNINNKLISRDIKATFVYKVSDTILDQTDNIIISIMFGTLIVGYYSNYFLIITYLVNIAGIIARGLVASFGNLNAENNMQKTYEIFKSSLLLFTIYGIICTNCYICGIQDFIKIWIGNEYILDYMIIVSAMMVFYLRMVTNSMWVYRTSMGLFNEVKKASIISALVNIALSIILGKYLGIWGIIIATALARILTTFWFEPIVLFNRFKKPVSEYFIIQLKNLLLLIFIVLLSFVTCNYIKGDGFGLFIIKMIICLLYSLLIIVLFYRKTDDYKILKDRILIGVLNRKSLK